MFGFDEDCWICKANVEVSPVREFSKYFRKHKALESILIRESNLVIKSFIGCCIAFIFLLHRGRFSYGLNEGGLGCGISINQGNVVISPLCD